MPKMAPRWAQDGTKIGIDGPKIGQDVAKIGQDGPKIGQVGAKIGQTGAKIGHVGTKSGQTGAKMGQVGAQIDQDDPKIGQDGPKIGQDGANFEDLFEFLIFCKILTNIEKKACCFNTFFSFLLLFTTLLSDPEQQNCLIELSIDKLRGLASFGLARVWESTSLTRWSQDDAR